MVWMQGVLTVYDLKLWFERNTHVSMKKCSFNCAYSIKRFFNSAMSEWMKDSRYTFFYTLNMLSWEPWSRANHQSIHQIRSWESRTKILCRGKYSLPNSVLFKTSRSIEIFNLKKIKFKNVKGKAGRGLKRVYKCRNIL